MSNKLFKPYFFPILAAVMGLACSPLDSFVVTAIAETQTAAISLTSSSPISGVTSDLPTAIAITQTAVTTIASSSPAATSTPHLAPSIAQTQTAAISMAIPSLTPVLTSHPTQNGGIVYSDDFSSLDSGWPRHKSDRAVYSYSDGQYFLAVEAAENEALAFASPSQSFEDGVLSVDVRHISGDSGTSVIVAWRVQTWRNCYTLLISDDGYLSVRTLEDGDWTTIIDWTKREMLHTDHQANHIDIEFVGATSTIYINGILADSITDSKFKSGDIGFAVLSSHESSVAGEFDNVIVYDSDSWQPPK